MRRYLVAGLVARRVDGLLDGRSDGSRARESAGRVVFGVQRQPLSSGEIEDIALDGIFRVVAEYYRSKSAVESKAEKYQATHPPSALFGPCGQYEQWLRTRQSAVSNSERAEYSHSKYNGIRAGEFAKSLMVHTHV